MLTIATLAGRVRVALVASSLVLAACSSKTFVVATQCPSPLGGHASIAGGDAGDNVLFGMTCARKTGAPCRDAAKLDKHGCPIFVTFDTCGGDICLGNQLIPRADAGPGSEEDAGSELDGGEANGAH